MQYHKSVLLKESIDALEVSNGGVYVDTTFGGGGHSREILSRVQNCSLYSFDQDEDALENELDDERLTLIHSNFSELENSLKLYRVDKVDGVLADLGVSSHQFDSEQRVFGLEGRGQDSLFQVMTDFETKELKSEFFTTRRRFHPRP